MLIFCRNSIDEALDISPPEHRHESILLNFINLLIQSDCSRVTYHRQTEDPSQKLSTSIRAENKKAPLLSREGFRTIIIKRDIKSQFK
jgi:hypothetical protein